MQGFTLTDQHVALLRAAHVGWNEVEWGAASIDGKRPYGSGDYLRDIHEILTPGSRWDSEHDLPSDLTPVEWAQLVEHYKGLHRALETALQVVLASGSFEPGIYCAQEYQRDWKRAV